MSKGKFCIAVFLYTCILFIPTRIFCMRMLYMWVVNKQCLISVYSNFLAIVLIVTKHILSIVCDLTVSKYARF